LASLSPNFLLLCGALAVGGVGLAAVFGSNNALLFQVVASDRRASAVGVNSISVYLGLLTGPFLGGFLAQVSWSVVFLPALALLLVSVVLAGGPSPSRGGAERVLIGWTRRCWRFRWPWWCWASRRLLRFSRV
jgi:MFS family permease